MLSGCGCDKQEQQDAPASQTANESSAQSATGGTQAESQASSTGSDSTLAGGWTFNTQKAPPLLESDEDALFSAAVSDQHGIYFNPVSLLATQREAPTDDSPFRYAFLCQVSLNGSPDSASWNVVTVSAPDLAHPTVEKITPIEPSDPHTASGFDNPSSPYAWVIDEDDVDDAAMSPISDDALAVFSSAVHSTPGTTRAPIALIATQVVSGTNYLFVVENTFDNGSQPTISFVTVYRDTQGACSITSDKYFDIEYYVPQTTAASQPQGQQGQQDQQSQQNQQGQQGQQGGSPVIDPDDPFYDPSHTDGEAVTIKLPLEDTPIYANWERDGCGAWWACFTTDNGTRIAAQADEDGEWHFYVEETMMPVHRSGAESTDYGEMGPAGKPSHWVDIETESQWF